MYSVHIEQYPLSPTKTRVPIYEGCTYVPEKLLR